MKTVIGDWQQFRKDVISDNAPPMQLVEMQHSFYAGYHCAMVAIMEVIADPTSVSDAAGKLTALTTEIREYFESLRPKR